MLTILLVLVAAGFAVAAGANDGSSILSAGLRVPGLRPVSSMAVLLAAVVVGPMLLFGTGVATTLEHGLVPARGAEGRVVLLVAAGSAVVVVYLLSRAGRPTSLTLALVGAITGAGLGRGLPVTTSTLVTIVAYGIAAPVLCAFLAFGASRVALRALSGRKMSRRVRRVHTVAYSLQCLAYSANGGQKMLAVAAVAVGATSGGLVHESWWLEVGIAVLFGLGILLSVRRISTSIGKEILTVHLRHALVAESCSFAVVLAAGLAGVPLTMSQSVTGALVGAGASEARTRVRWPAALRIAAAWAVTLPASGGVAAAAGGALRWL
jgi:PiT family inorganic phosphate transporter